MKSDSNGLVGSVRETVVLEPDESGTAPSGDVYMDYAATTPVDPRVVETMARYLGQDGVFGNSASRSHRFGQEAREAVEQARVQVAQLINVEPSEIIWTSGATESINLAIKGVARGCTDDGRHLVTSSIEHKAVLDSCQQLSDEGFEITYVDPDEDGLISPERVSQAIRDDTILVTLMHVNNEVGTIVDIGSISEMTRSRDIALHVDAVQGAARLPLDMDSLHADLVSLSGHKMYGPKGIGALYVRSRSRLRMQALMHGGGQEQGMRPGTLATHQIAGMGEAAQLVLERRADDIAVTTRLDRRLINGLMQIDQAVLNGNQQQRVPGIVSIGFPCVSNESLMMVLKEVAISSGSACTSERVEPSHVLRSLDVPEKLANWSVRFSLGRFSTRDEVDFAVDRVRHYVTSLRCLSPEWQA